MTARPPIVLHDRSIVVLCGVMLSLNAISCDILMPAFLTLEQTFAAPRAAVLALMPIYLMAAALGQLVFGPLSDRHGRRPILRIGIAFYLAGTLAALTAPSLHGLYAARLLQGFGASCMIVIARAILRDRFEGDALARAMAFAFAVFVIGPMLAPLFGVVLLDLGGWRGPFWGLTAVGALLAVAQLKVPETNLRPDARALEPRRLLSAVGRLFANRQSRHFLLSLTVCQMVIIVFVTNMPQMLRSAFGLEGMPFAFVFALASLGIVAGQFANARLIKQYGLAEAAKLVAVLVMSVALATVAFGPRVGVVGFIGLIFAFNATFLVLYGHGMSMVLDPHHDIAGTASAVLGSVTQFCGSLAALAAIPYFDGTIGQWAPWHALVMGCVALWVYMFRPTAPRPLHDHVSDRSRGKVDPA